MSKKNIRVGIKMSYVDDYGNIADNGDTLYYGEYEVDPDNGLRYTYVKTPGGSFDILKTENTEMAKELIDKVVEVNTKDSNNYSPKLTFVLQFDETDRVSTWNDNIEDLFKKEFNNLYNELKPCILQVKDSDIKRVIAMPFLNEKVVVTDYELTAGRRSRNVGDLTVELFRIYMRNNLEFLDQFLEICNEGFNSLDILRIKDMQQDEELGDISVAANSWELICELIRKWMADTMDKFKTLHKKVTLDLRNYRNNLMCLVKLFSNNEKDKPYIDSEIYSQGFALVSVRHSFQGVLIDLKINQPDNNSLMPPINSLEYTIKLRGGTTYDIYTSAENLEYYVTSTENPQSYLVPYKNSRIYPGDYRVPEIHLTLENDDTRNPWRFTVGGTQFEQAVVGTVYNYLWRSNNTGAWGTAGSSGVLSAEGRYYAHHNGTWQGPWNFPQNSGKINIADSVTVTVTMDTRYGGNFDRGGGTIYLIGPNGYTWSRSFQWGHGDNWSGTFTGSYTLTDAEMTALGGKNVTCTGRYSQYGDGGSGDLFMHYQWKVVAKKKSGNNTDALTQNKDIGEFKNTRIPFTMNMTVSEMRKKYDTLTVYVDDYYALTSVNGTGGIQGFHDLTTKKRCSYQGTGVYNSNINSIPDNKIKVPLKMNALSDATNAMHSWEFPISLLNDNGDWYEIYSTSTEGSWFGYSGEHKRTKDKPYGGVRYTYYIRVKNQSTLELLVNYYQYADGEDGDLVQTQCAGRVSALILGTKNGTTIFSIEEAYNSSLANAVVSTPINDRNGKNGITYSETSAMYYYVLDKIISYSISKIPDAVINLGFNCNFNFKATANYKDTCRTGNTLLSGNFKDYTTRGYADRTNSGTAVPNVQTVGLVDTSSIMNLQTDSELFIQYQPPTSSNETLVKEILMGTLDGYRMTFQVYATVSLSGDTKTVRLRARFNINHPTGHRMVFRLSYSCSPGYIVAPMGNGAVVPLLQNRPSGKALELLDLRTNVPNYVQLLKNTDAMFYYEENKTTNKTATSGGSAYWPWTHSVNVGSSQDITIGCNCNFRMKYSRDHHGTSSVDEYNAEGNIKSYKVYWSNTGNNVGVNLGAVSAPDDFVDDNLEALRQAHVAITLSRKSLTGDFKQVYSSPNFAAKPIAHVGPGSWFFRVYVRLVDSTLEVKYQFEGIGSVGNDGNRNILRCSWYAKSGVACQNPTRKTFHVLDLDNGDEYRVPDGGGIIGASTKSISTTSLFRRAKRALDMESIINSNIEVSDIASISRITNTKLKIGINLNLGTKFTILGELNKTNRSDIIENDIIFKDDSEIYYDSNGNIIETDGITTRKIDFNESTKELLDRIESDQITYSDSGYSPENLSEVPSYQNSRFITDFKINKLNYKINDNVTFETNETPSSIFVDDPNTISDEDIRSNNADIVFSLNPEILTFEWIKIFEFMAVSYDSIYNDSIKNVSCVVSCYIRKDSRNIQIGWQVSTNTDNINQNELPFIITNVIRWKYKVMGVFI